MKRFVQLISVYLSFAAVAQAADNDATITFTAPTTYTDGTPIPAGTVLSYNVYQGLKGGIKGKVSTITSLTTLITTGLVPGNDYCFEVSVLANATESARSGEGCKLIKGPTAQAVVITVR